MSRMSVDRIDRLVSRRRLRRPAAPTPPNPQISDAHSGSSGRFTPLFLALALVAFLFVPAAARTAPETAAETQIAAPQTPNAQNLLAGLPSRFEPNVGQAADGIAYTLKAKGYLASLGASAIYFAFPEGKAPENPEDRLGEPRREPVSANRSVVAMSFVGANPDPVIEALDPQPGVSNYFLGNDPKNWHTEVPGYSKIYYRDLYDGIDMVIYDDRGQVRYDFIVAPGADPAQIAIAFEGAEGLKLSDTGDLVVSSPYGDLTHKAPFSYQENQEIESSFEVSGARVGFKLGAYDRTRELTIDPVLDYSSYLGGSGFELARSIAVDSTGAAYIVGELTSTNFPTAGTPFQGSSGGSSDGFVTKVAPDGQSLVYSSYLGGTGAEIARGVAVDSSGAAYVAGETSSGNFPTAGSPFQSSLAGGAGYDAFVTKVSPSGSGLTYSSYLGGTGGDLGIAIDVDSSGSAYVAGTASSTDFPTAGSPFQSVSGGSPDAFVSKIAADGQRLVYSSYLGGSGTDVARGIAVDSAGAAFIAGHTNSTDFPVAGPAFQSTSGGSDDPFVTKVASNGQSVLYSDYLGGPSGDYGYAVVVDLLGAAYVTGVTSSFNFPVAGSPFQASSGGAVDAFVVKVATDGLSRVYSSYLGGSAADSGRGITVDSSGVAHIAGVTQSTDFPVSGSYFQGAYGGGSADAFVAVVSANGQSVVYSSYLGGIDQDSGEAIAIDASRNVYVAGETRSANFPAIGGPFQGAIAGDYDAFVTKVSAAMVTISGTFTGGQHGGVAVYDATTGSQVSYSCCMTDDTWSASVPPVSCPSGYKVLWISPDSTKQSRWYNLKDNWSSGDCVSAPSSGNDMTIPAAGVISGYVKDASTATDISGASVYAFKASDGTYVGYGSTSANGRYELPLSTSETYKLLVHPGSAYVNQWYSGAQGFAEATAQAAPATVNFSVTPAGVIDGYVKDATTAADLNGYPVYAYTTAGTFFAYAQTDRGQGPGRYRIQVNPGESYKLKSTGGPYSTQWFSGASSFSSATATAAPFTANFSRS